MSDPCVVDSESRQQVDSRDESSRLRLRGLAWRTVTRVPRGSCGFPRDHFSEGNLDHGGHRSPIDNSRVPVCVASCDPHRVDAGGLRGFVVKAAAVQVQFRLLHHAKEEV